MSVADPLLGKLIDGRYRVDRAIGSGGFGTVYAAFHVGLGSPVALKALRPPPSVKPEGLAKLCGAFFDEARTLKRLRHPNIVAALDVGLLPAGEDGVELPYLVMEWCGGPTLERHLSEHGAPLSLEEAWDLFEPLLEAMAHAHDHGIAHRDLKPSNVLLEFDDGNGALWPRLIDFGIAKMVAENDRAGSGDTNTVSGRSPFTPRYASPEQLGGSRTGIWTDVHALGLLFVELVIGRPPIGDDEKAMEAIFTPRRPTPRMFGVDVKGLEQVAERALALRPADRQTDARALLEEMREAIAIDYPGIGERAEGLRRSSRPSRESASIEPSDEPAAPSSKTLHTGSGVSSFARRAERSLHGALASRDSFDEADRLVGDRFRIEARAGAGGSSVVYRANDAHRPGPVALKIPKDPTAFDRVRFEREVEILSGANNRRIVEYIAHGSDPLVGPWLAMEWLEGETLSANIARDGITAKAAVRLAIDLAETLGSLHDRGIVHRDIKPSNVFLVACDVRKSKLLDFGIARARTHPSITSAGALVGTVGYMSPEQVRGEDNLDHRSDVFSLGCLLFQCVTGHLPFEGDHPTEWLMKLALEDAPRADTLASDLPAGLTDVLARMLAKQAAARYASMIEVASALGGIDVAASDDPNSRRSVRAPAITSTERRFVSLLLFRKPKGRDASAGDVSLLVERHGGILHESPDGWVLVTFGLVAVPTDLALGAAKLALALATPSLRVVVLSTWLTKDGAGFKPAIEIATTLFEMTAPGSVVVDESTRSLLQGAIASTPIAESSGNTTGPARPARAHLLHGERPGARRTSSPFVGRDREMGTILQAFEHAEQERTAEVVLALGAAGIGKSRLAREARVRIAERWPSVTVLSGTAESGERGGSLGLVRSMLRRFFFIPEGPGDADQLKPMLRFELASIVDPADLDLEVDFLSELLFSPGSGEPTRAVRAARSEARLMTDQITRAVDLWLRGLLRRGPLLFSIESIHAADEASLLLVDRFLGSVEDSPVLLLGTGRLETTEKFPTLFAERSVTTIKLRELVTRAAEQLTRALLPSAREVLVERVVELGGGNPFLLEELARAAREGQDQELPNSVLALSQSRLDRLTERERRFLRAASVFGDRFFVEGVSALLAGADETETLAALTRRDVVRALDAQATPPCAQMFQSSIVRQVAYASIPESELARAHLRAGDFLESIGDTRALELAFHFERGGALRRSAAWYLRAARQSLEAMDLASAASWGQKAQAADLRPGSVGAALCLRAQVEEARWNWPEVKSLAGQAMELLPEGSVLWFMAAHSLAPALTRTADYDGFARLAARVRRTTPAPEARSTAVLAWASAANMLALGGFLEEANETLARVDALEPLLPAGTPGTAYALMARGGIAMKSGDLGSYNKLRYAAAERFELSNDWRKAIEVRGTCGYADCLLGRYEEALATLESCVTRALAHRMTTVHYLRHNVGFVLLQLGRHAEARTTLESTLDPLHRIDPRLERGSLSYLSRTLVALGELDLAERHARTALEGAERPNAKMAARGDLAHVLLARGHWAEAMPLAEDAAAPLTQDGPYDEGEMFVRVVSIRCLASSGDLARARVGAREAEARLAFLAARISDPIYRKSFVERVNDHIALRAVAQSLGG